MPTRPGRSARSLLDHGGPLAARLAGYERREGQLRMAEAVEEAFAAGDRLLVEAGTGVGKTLAYLVPAARLGEPVVVSTGTRNLQDQIFRKDVPLLRQRLGLPVRATCLKGRDNYACLHRLRDFGRAPAFPERDEARFFRRVEEWAGSTETGDRAELEDVPEEVSFWREVNARADTCLGRRCPDYDDCFLVRMRRQAAESDLIVVNHHLLLADLVVKSGDFGAILPDYRHVVIDEAHGLEDVATHYFGRRASWFRCRELADDAARFLGRAGRDEAGLLRLAGAARDSARDLFDSFGEPQGRERLRPATWTPPRAEARDRLLGVLAELAAGLSALREPTEDLESAGRRAAELAADLRFILLAEDLEHVRFVEHGERGASFHAAPIDVAGPLREHLFARVASAVLTSATLTVGGEFDFVRERLGLPEARALSVSSPFDYPRQAVLYLPADLPPPDAAGFYPAAARQVRELLAITGGRAFLLFTSYAGLHRMRDLLDAERHDFTLIVQGDGPRHALLERFRRGRRAVLLATASFWQGVDVPGEALSLVVIDRLPFEVPSDPVVEARAARLRQQGENPFLRYQLPQAVIGLKQGAGRLIRTTTDRGVLVLLDPRVRTRPYGAAFLESLPPFARASTLAEVRRFLERR
jgi:ATP-dependent DNA helicase DinG